MATYTADDFINVVVPDMLRRLIWWAYGMQRSRVQSQTWIGQPSHCMLNDFAFHAAEERVTAAWVAWFGPIEATLPATLTHQEAARHLQSLSRFVMDLYVHEEIV